MSNFVLALIRYITFLENNKYFTSVKELEKKLSEEGEETKRLIDFTNTSQEEERLLLKANWLVSKIRKNTYFKLIDYWNDGKISPDLRERELLEKYRDKTIENYDNIKSIAKLVFPSDNEVIEIIENEKSECSEKIKFLDKLLSRGERSLQPKSEIDELNRQISKKNNLIADLLIRNQTISDSEKAELKKLKEEKEQLILQIKTKKNNFNKYSPSKFNWLYVVIPLGILLISIIAYRLGKKRKH